MKFRWRYWLNVLRCKLGFHDTTITALNDIYCQVCGEVVGIYDDEEVVIE